MSKRKIHNEDFKLRCAAGAMAGWAHCSTNANEITCLKCLEKSLPKLSKLDPPPKEKKMKKNKKTSDRRYYILVNDSIADTVEGSLQDAKDYAQEHIFKRYQAGTTVEIVEQISICIIPDDTSIWQDV
jgi:hypothetical protein